MRCRRNNTRPRDTEPTSVRHNNGVDLKKFEEFLSTFEHNHAANLYIIDEIGKMECLSELFIQMVKEILDSPRVFIATVSLHGSGFIEDVKRRKDVIIFNLRPDEETRCIDKLYHFLI